MKRILGSVLVSTAVIGFSIHASASDDVELDKSSNQVSSKATIDVNPGKAEPTRPENPDNPSGETGQNGPLSIDNVIVFNFADMNLSGKTQKISLENDGTKSSAKRNIQITDTRGTGAGWNLQIKQSPLTDTTTTSEITKTLDGAYITLSNGAVVAGVDNTNTGDVTAYPTLDDYDVNAVNKGDFQKLVTAKEGQGLGTFKIFYNQSKEGVINQKPNDIQLVVPSGNLIGSYKGVVTWALSDGPDGEPVS